MPLNASNWQEFLKFVTKKKQDALFLWRLGTEYCPVQITKVMKGADKKKTYFEERKTKLLIVVFRQDLKLVEVRLNIHRYDVVRAEHRLYREGIGVRFLRTDEAYQGELLAQVGSVSARLDADLAGERDLVQLCLELIPKQAVDSGDNFSLWESGLSSLQAKSRNTTTSFEPIVALAHSSHAELLVPLWSELEQIQRRLLDLGLQIDQKKDEIFRLQQDDVLEVLLGPVQLYKSLLDDLLQQYRARLRKYMHEVLNFIYSSLKTWVDEDLSQLEQTKQALLEKNTDNSKVPVIEGDLRRAQQARASLHSPERYDPSRGFDKYLADIANGIYDYIAPMPIRRFVFKGFGDVSLDVLDFSKSLQQNMQEYLTQNGLTHLAQPAEMPVNPVSVQYLISTSRLLRSTLQGKQRELFSATYDADTEPLRDRARRIIDAAMPGAQPTQDWFDPTLKPRVKDSLLAICEAVLEYLSATFYCASEVIPRLNKLRVRALSGGGRQYYFVQRTTQSGDSNGMAVALMLFPQHHLHFLVSNKDIEKAKSFLDFYGRFGLTKERVMVSVVYSDNSQFDLTGIRAALANHCAQIKVVRYLGGKESNKEDQLYQLVVNTNYANPLDLLYMNIAYNHDQNVYQEVGASTSSIKRLLAENGSNYIKVARSVHWAMARNIRPNEQQDISAFVDGFLENLVTHYEQKAEKFQQEPKKWHPQQYVPPSAVSHDKPVYVVLMWIRGPQGEEGLAANLEAKGGSLVPKGGKPWHHATYQLWVTMRQIAYQLMDQLGAPVCLVPVGDVLKSDNYHELKTQTEKWNNLVFSGSPKVKADKPYYLTKFFEKLEVFKNRNRFTQMYLFYELFKRRDFRFVQVGLRSGAIEQGMYLGIPTVYIDIEQKAVTKARSGEPNTIQRMYAMTAKENGFPMFHCQFSSNAIGTSPYQVDHEGRGTLLEKLNTGAPGSDEDSALLKGTLTGVEAQQMKLKLAEIYKGYGSYYSHLQPDAPPSERPL